MEPQFLPQSNPALTGIMNLPEQAPSPIGVGLSEQPSQGAMSPQMLEMHLNQFATQYPEQLTQIRTAIMQAMQTGELTQQELNTIIQLATAVVQNPELYPHVRRFAIQNGIATEQDLPPQYDPGLAFVILLAARSIQAGDVGAPM